MRARHWFPFRSFPTPFLAMLALGTALSGCGDGTSSNEPTPYPVAWSSTRDGVVTIQLRYLLPITTADCSEDSVFVTGPSISGSKALDCAPVRGTAFAAELVVTPAPPAVPATYRFTATIAGATTTPSATVNCYQPLPVGLAPAEGATVPSPVTLRWVAATATGVRYTVSLTPTPTGFQGSVIDQDTLRVSLSNGNHFWGVEAAPVEDLADGTSARRCEAMWSGPGAFTVN
jgi:hypothetical protein